MTINELCKEAHDIAKDKGWHNPERNIPELLCLVHSEVSESLESYRNNEHLCGIKIISGGKPEGFPVELADAIIRIFDICGLHDIDLGYAIKLKMEYNKTREYRHGNKRA